MLLCWIVIRAAAHFVSAFDTKKPPPSARRGDEGGGGKMNAFILSITVLKIVPVPVDRIGSLGSSRSIENP